MRELDWSSLPVAVLRGALNFANRMVSAGFGDNIGQGIFAKMQVDLTTSRKLAYKEKSGALYRFRQAVRDFPSWQANWLAKFSDADKTIIGGRNYGITDILQAIERLGMHESLKGVKGPYAEIILVDMFQRYLMRDQDGNRALRINEDGSMEVATLSEKRLDSEGNVVVYKDSGEPIYNYGGYISAEDSYIRVSAPPSKYKLSVAFMIVF